MKSSFLAFFVAVFFLTGCGNSHSTKTQVDEGPLDQVIYGTWISVVCESQSRRVYNFTKTADGEDVLVVWFVKYKDEGCTAQKWTNTKVGESVMKYKVENTDPKYAMGKLFTYSENFESQDTVALVGGQLQVGERLYERAFVQVEIVDVVSQ